MLYPLDYSKLCYLILMTTMVGISNAAGMGGGGIAVPCLILFFDYKPKDAVDIAYIYVLFGGLGNAVQNCRRTHPSNPSKSLINYDLALVSLTGIIFGAMIGYFFNKLSYDIIIVSVLFLLLLQTLFKNQKKIRQMQEQTTSQLTQKLKRKPTVEEEFDEKFSNANESISMHMSIERRQSQYLSYGDTFSKIKQFIIITFISVILILIKGSPKFPSIVNLPVCGYLSLLYYIFMAIVFMTIYFRIKSNLVEEQCLTDEDISSMNSNAFNAFLAGIIGSFLGLGGGIILTANWLQLGLHPQESTATATFMVIFTGSISAFQVFLAGNYMFLDFITFALFSIVASYMIAKIVYKVSKAMNNPFLTIYLLQILLIVSLIILIQTTWNKIKNDPDSLTRVKQFC